MLRQNVTTGEGGSEKRDVTQDVKFLLKKSAKRRKKFVENPPIDLAVCRKNLKNIDYSKETC